MTPQSHLRLLEKSEDAPAKYSADYICFQIAHRCFGDDDDLKMLDKSIAMCGKAYHVTEVTSNIKLTVDERQPA